MDRSNTTAGTTDSDVYVEYTAASRELTMIFDDGYRMAYIGIGCFGIPGNILTIFVLLYFPNLRKKCVNLCIINQSLLDLALCIVTIFQQLYNTLSATGYTGLSAEIFCKSWLSTTVSWSLATSSGYNLMVMTIERYLAITRPLSHNEYNFRKRLYFLFPMIWFSGFLLNMPDQFFYSITFNSCNYMIGTLTQTHAYLLYSYYVVFHFALPALIMLVLYIHMGLVLYKGHEMQKSMVANTSSEENILLTAQKNIVFTCMILLALYCSCWLWNESNIILFITQTVNLSVMSHHLSSMVVVLNSCVNPFIYTMRYQEFQYHLRKLMPCASCHIDDGELTRKSTSNTSRKTSSTAKLTSSTVEKTQNDLRV